MTSRVLRHRAEAKAREKLEEQENDEESLGRHLGEMETVTVNELEHFVNHAANSDQPPPQVGQRVAVRVENEQDELEVVFGMVVAVEEVGRLPVVLVDGWQRSFVFEEWRILNEGSEFALGERLYVCDKPMLSEKLTASQSSSSLLTAHQIEWKAGVVNAFDGAGLPLVQLDGWDEAFPFDMYRKCLRNDLMDAQDSLKAKKVKTTHDMQNSSQKHKGADEKSSTSKEQPGRKKQKKMAKGVTDGEEELSLLTANYAVVGCLWGFSFVIGPLAGGLLVSIGGDARFACFVVACSDALALMVAQVDFVQTFIMIKLAI